MPKLLETPALQIRDSRRELEPEQTAQREDMVGIAAAVGMVATGHDLALMVEQPVKDMRGFAGSRRDYLGVERCVAIGKVRVELDPGIIAVMGIDGACIAAEAAGPEELAVRGGGGAAAKHRRKRLALLLADQTAERQSIGLIADVPVGCPGELTETGDAAHLGHPRQAEIEPVGSSP